MEKTSRLALVIPIFLTAMENNTLSKNDCMGCAVGNLIAGTHGISLIKVYNRLNQPEISAINCPLLAPGWDSAWITFVQAYRAVEGGKGLWGYSTKDSETLLLQYPGSFPHLPFDLMEISTIEMEYEFHARIIKNHEVINIPRFMDDQANALMAVLEMIKRWDNDPIDLKLEFKDKADYLIHNHPWEI